LDRTAGIDVSRAFVHEGAEHSSDVLGLVRVLRRRRLPRRVGSRGECKRFAEQVQRAVVAPEDQPGVDEPLQRHTGWTRREAGIGADGVERRRAEHEGRNHSSPVVVGEETDELAAVERRLGHGR
jgi:hypothetical protein